MVKDLPIPKGRKYALNFALADKLWGRLREVEKAI